MDAESVIKIILDRTAILAAGEDRAKRAERLSERARDDAAVRASRAEMRLSDVSRDLKAAEAKICEWAEYASQLRSAIDAIDPKAIKRKKIVLPDMPRPLETEIPF